MSHHAYPTDFPLEEMKAVIGYVTKKDITLAEVAQDAWWIQGYAMAQLLGGAPILAPAPLAESMHPLAVHAAENPTVAAFTETEAVVAMQQAVEEHKIHKGTKDKPLVGSFVFPWAQLVLFLLQLLSGVVVKPS